LRLFFAIPLQPDVQGLLGQLRPGEGRDYRWVDPAMLHVTLAFLGEQPAERFDILKTVGESAAGASEPGMLRLGQPGSFGSRKAPSVLWIGLDGDLAALTEVQSRLSAQLRGAGFKLEDRPFRAHITLARRRASAPAGAVPGWPPARRPEPVEFPMRQLTLFESRLSPRGATYITLLEFPIGRAYSHRH
jgi:2'-5' RNA ligase